MSLEYPNRINGSNNGNGNGNSSVSTDDTTTGKPKLDERFLSNIQGKEFVLYAGLFDLVHQHGLIKLEVEHIQPPSQENNMTPICKATATTKEGKVFSDIGDCNPNNVNKKIAPHLIRMVSTRCKARVLRDLCNIGITCCLEELGDLEETLEEDKPARRGRPAKSELPTAPKAETHRSYPKKCGSILHRKRLLHMSCSLISLWSCLIPLDTFRLWNVDRFRCGFKLTNQRAQQDCFRLSLWTRNQRGNLRDLQSGPSVERRR